MKLSRWLKEYRTARQMTMQDLADRSGLTKGYIGALEKGINPSTNKPYKPSEEALRKLAAGTDRTVEELLAEVDDVRMPESSAVNPDEEQVLTAYRRLNFTDRQMFRQLLTLFAMASA